MQILKRSAPTEDTFGSHTHALQIFINLSAAQKLGTPGSRHVAATAMPVIEGPGHRVRVMNGIRVYPIAKLKHNVVGLAKSAEALGLPTAIITTSAEMH